MNNKRDIWQLPLLATNHLKVKQILGVFHACQQVPHVNQVEVLQVCWTLHLYGQETKHFPGPFRNIGTVRTHDLLWWCIAPSLMQVNNNFIIFWKRPCSVLVLFLGQKNPKKEPWKNMVFSSWVKNHILERGLFIGINKASIHPQNSVCIYGGRTNSFWQRKEWRKNSSIVIYYMVKNIILT